MFSSFNSRNDFVSPKFLDPQLMDYLLKMASNRCKNTFYAQNEKYFMMSEHGYKFEGIHVILLTFMNIIIA